MSQTSILETAGEVVAVDSPPGWVTRLLDEASAGALSPRPASATMAIHIEATSRPFSVAGLTPLTRGAWSHALEVPPPRERSPDALPGPLVASVRGRAPLHAVACTTGDAVTLLAGPGGVGKSTLLQLELAHGGRATSDNLCVADGQSVWGLVEPMRVAGTHGRRMPHGRVEVQFAGRVAQLSPDHLVIVRRSNGEARVLTTCDPETAVRSLVTGTYAAGELGRFWSFAATLAAGTGIGPSHPLVAETARAFAVRLNCYELHLPRRPGARLTEMLNRVEAIA